MFSVIPGAMGALVAAAAMASHQQAGQQQTQPQAVTTQANLASSMGGITSTANSTALGMQGIGGMAGT